MQNDNLRLLKLQQLKLEELKLQRLKEDKAWLFKPYPWQYKFWAESRTNKQLMLMAANQVGKTEATTLAMTYHLTGRYPPDWPGFRFSRPVIGWVLGVKSEQIKDVLQRRLLGKIIDRNNTCEGGFIPNYLIKNDSIVKGQLKDSIKEVLIKHVSGGYSELSFYSYSQGQDTFMGNIVDIALIDEEPKDPTIYGQILIRTANGNGGNGGLLMISMTPEHGTTQLVHQFTTNLQDQQFFMNVTWADAPHMTLEKQKQLLAAMPEHERDMRSKGIPLLGSGRVYPYNEENFYWDGDEIPPYWARINGIDFGWNYTALVWCAWDRDTDTFYIYDAKKITQTEPSQNSLVMRKPAQWIPWSWPSDGHQPERKCGQPQADLYRDNGVNMLLTHATDEAGTVSVEAGITRFKEYMIGGRFKVRRHLAPFFEEYRLYHRKDGKIVKANDHILDASRYAEMMKRFAVTESDVKGAMIVPSYINTSKKSWR